MPIFNAEVQNSQSVWKSPDGQREIFEVNLLVNGKAVTAKTYSNDIAQAGFSGELESYEKPGKNGSQMFVRQAPKEGGFTPRPQGSAPSSTGHSGSSKDGYDNYTMYLSYVKDVAVALVNSGTYEPELLDSVMSDVAITAAKFHDSSEKAREGAPEAPVEAVNKDVVAPVNEDDPWNGLI